MIVETCSYPECKNYVFVRKTTHGPLCNGHYAQYRRGKTLAPLRTYHPREISEDHGTCTQPDCEHPSWRKTGPCQTHQRQIWAGETPVKVRNYTFQNGRECSEPNCENPSKSRGKCARHYRMDRMLEMGKCVIPECVHKVHNVTTGYCAKHYSRHRKSQGVVS